MHVYIAPEPGYPVLRCCTVLLSLTQTSVHIDNVNCMKSYILCIICIFIGTYVCTCMHAWVFMHYIRCNIYQVNVFNTNIVFLTLF